MPKLGRDPPLLPGPTKFDKVVLNGMQCLGVALLVFGLLSMVWGMTRERF